MVCQLSRHKMSLTYAARPTVPQVSRYSVSMTWRGNENYWAQPSPKAKQIKSEFIEQQQSPRVIIHTKPGSDWGQEKGDITDPFNNVSALTSLDDFPEEGHVTSPRYEAVRGAHVPSGHMRPFRQAQEGGGGVINQIAKMPTMQRMQPLRVSQGPQVTVDHGFSPPRRAVVPPLILWTQNTNGSIPQ